MKKEIDCQVFEDQLDGLVRGTLPREGARLLGIHAASCPECATLLGVQEHLASPTLGELEEAVPAELLAGIWPGVRSGLAAGTAAARQRDPGRRHRAPLVPALAAASVALLLASGFLWVLLLQSRARAEVLARQLLDQEARIALVEGPGTPSGGNGIRAFSPGGGWLDALGREEEVTLAGLRSLLLSLPGNPTVLSPSQAEALLGAARLRAPAVWRAGATGLPRGGGIRARDLLRFLESLDLDPDRTLPASRIRDLLS